jgi:hypothetical protein
MHRGEDLRTGWDHAKTGVPKSLFKVMETTLAEDGPEQAARLRIKRMV